MIEEAQADKADVLVATTDDDSVNLMTMFLEKDCGIKTTGDYPGDIALRLSV